MPNPSFDQFITTTLQYWASRTLADNIFNGHALFFWLKERDRIQPIPGGRTIVEPIVHAINTTVRSMGFYDTVDTSVQAGISAAEYSWSVVAGTIVLSEAEIRQNQGPSQVINLLEAKGDQLEQSFQEELSTELFGDGTGNGGLDMLGLRAIILNSGTLGGIDGTANTYWRSAADTTSAALTLAQMRTVWRTASVGNQHPDFTITEGVLWDAYEALLQPNVRYEDELMANAGFTTLRWKGRPLVYDEQCPTGYMFFINSKYLKLRPHSSMAKSFRAEPIQQPTDQLVRIAKVWWMAQLTTNNRRMHGFLSGKTA